MTTAMLTHLRSRVSLREVTTQSDTPPELVLLMENLADASTVTAKQIEVWTRRDPRFALLTLQLAEKG